MKFQTVPTSRTARLRQLSLERKIKTTDGYLSTGNWAINPAYANDNLLKAFEKDIEKSQHALKLLLKETKKLAIHVVWEVVRTEIGTADTLTSIFKTKSNVLIGFQSGFIDYFMKTIKDFNIKVSTPIQAGLMFSGDYEVGIIMPMKIPEEQEEEIKEYLTKQNPKPRKEVSNIVDDLIVECIPVEKSSEVKDVSVEKSPQIKDVSVKSPRNICYLCQKTIEDRRDSVYITQGMQRHSSCDPTEIGENKDMIRTSSVKREKGKKKEITKKVKKVPVIEEELLDDDDEDKTPIRGKRIPKKVPVTEREPVNESNAEPIPRVKRSRRHTKRNGTENVLLKLLEIPVHKIAAVTAVQSQIFLRDINGSVFVVEMSSLETLHSLISQASKEYKALKHAAEGIE
jgi:hypothetical protein